MKDRWWFRINPVNFRTTTAHMDELFQVIAEQCPQVQASITRQPAH